MKAAKAAHDAGRRVALTLSDAFCVDRYRDEFLNLVRKGTVDIVFANESELKSLYQTADFHAAIGQLRNDARFAVVTRSEHGCVVVTPASLTPVPAFPIDKLVDTTGAGDLFAAGFLVGLARGADHTTCGKFARRGRGSHSARRRAPATIAQGARRRQWAAQLAPSRTSNFGDRNAAAIISRHG